MTLLYRLIYFIVVRGLLPILHFVSSKVSKGYKLRKPHNQILPWLDAAKNQRPLWIHCASGEFEYALPVIREIKKKSPQQKIMVTYFTPSYVEKIKAEPLVDMVFPSPWDEPGTLKKFIEHHNPKALLFARTDVWFEMSRQCRFANIPVIVFSMTFHKKINIMLQAFLRWRWQFIDQFYVVSGDDCLSLQSVLPEAKVEVIGDSRYDQCFFRLGLEKKLPIDFGPSTKQLIVAGSTWPDDERVLLPAIQRTHGGARWVVVPHELSESHLVSLEQQLKALELSSVRLSRTTLWDGDSILIVDRMGLLAELYKLSDVSFVGGSFRKQVHSVMESLACGNLTFVGPFYENNREALEFSQIHMGSLALTPVQVVEDEDALVNGISLGLQSWSSVQREELRQLVLKKTGASEALASRILRFTQGD